MADQPQPLPGSKLLRYGMKIGVLAAVYFLTGRLGLTVAFSDSQVSLIWVPAGVAVAGVIFWGYSALPSIVIGSLAVELSAGFPFPAPFLMAAGATLEAAGAAFLLRRVVHFDRTLARVQDVVGFVLFAALLATAISAIVGTSTLAVTAVIPVSAYPSTWFTWWIGDAVGVLIVVPVILTGLNVRHFGWTWQRVLEAGALLLAVLAVSKILFIGPRGDDALYPLLFMTFPLMIWAALRFEQWGAALIGLLVAGEAMIGVAQGRGPFVRPSAPETLILLWSYMGVSLATALLLATVTAERKRVSQRFEAANRDLAASRDALQRLIQQIPLGIQVFDTHGMCTDANQAQRTIFGVPESEPLIGSYNIFEDRLAEQAGTNAGLRRALAGETVRLDDIVFNFAQADPRFASGTGQRIITVTFFPVFDEHQQIINVVALNTDVTERRRIEHELQQERDFAVQMMNALGQGVSVTNLDRRFEFINPAFAHMMGYEPEELIGKTTYEVVLPDDYPVIDHTRDERRAGRTSTYEIRLRHKDGSTIYTIVTGTPRWLNGKVIGSIAATTNLTEQKRAEETLRASQAQLQAIIENLPFDLWAADTDERYIFQNPISRELWGNRVGGTPDTSPNASDEIRAQWHATNRRALAGEVVRSEAQYTQHGELRFYENLLAPIRDGEKILGFIGINIDITQRKQAEAALRASEERYRLLVENSPVGIFVDDNNRIAYANPAFARIMGAKSPDELVGRDVFELIHPNFHAAVHQRERVVRELREPVPPLEEQYVRLDGTVVDVEVTSTPMDRIRGSVEQVMVYDIAERKRALAAEHEQRRLAEALRDTAASLTSTLSFDAVLDRILTQLARVVPYDAASICMIEADAAVIVRHRGYVEHGSAPQAVSNARFPLQDSVYQEFLTTKRPLVLTDVSNYPHWIVVPETDWIRSFAGAPVIVNDQVIGVINVDSATPGAFTDVHLGRLEAFASQASIAVQNARHTTELEHLIAEEHDQRMLAEALRDTAGVLNSTLSLDEVLDRILGQLTHVIPHDHSSITMIDGQEMVMVRHRGRHVSEDFSGQLRFPMDKGITVWMIEHKQPVVIDDVQGRPDWVDVPEMRWIRGFASAPIVVDGQVIGFINVDSAAPRTFHAFHADRLQAFAHQASIAVQNARHTADLQQLVAERTAELDLERRQLQAILDATGEGIYYRENNIIQYSNRALSNLTGYELGELIGQDSQILRADPITPEEVIRLDTSRAIVMSGETWRGETKLLRKDASTFDAALTISQVGKPHSQPFRTVTIVRDISQEKQLEAQKARFISDAAHELRTPITNLDTRLYLIRRQPQRLEEHLNVLETVKNHMYRLVENLLDMSRFERGVIALRRQHMVAQSLVQDVVRMQQPEAERKQLTLTENIPAAPLVIFADPDRMMQVLTNLVVNAIHYTPEGGRIAVSLTTEVDSHGETFVVLAVQDTGIGIAPEHLAHIFEPFYRASATGRGVGLGLSITYQIVELHKGEISVESDIGAGSSFRVRLPLVALPV